MKLLHPTTAILLLILAPNLVAEKELPKQEASLWKPIEWKIENPQWNGNPFDLNAVAAFTHDESGEQIETRLFYHGDSIWVLRFTGVKPGTWAFKTTSDDPDLDQLNGSVTITNPKNPERGFLKNHGGKWAWQGTEQCFVPQLVMWDYVSGAKNLRVIESNPEKVDELIQTFIVEHGFSGFHVPEVAAHWFDADADGTRTRQEMENPDLRTFASLETLIQKTHQAGGMVHIWPWGDQSRGQTPLQLKGRREGVVDRRLQRYIGARLGPLPGWTMGYGFDLDEWVSEKEIETWHQNLHAELGWPHLLGGRPKGTNREGKHSKYSDWNKPLDFASYEHHRPSYSVYRNAIAANPNKPVFSEDRFRIRNSKRYAKKDYSPELTLRGMYHSTLAGGVANIWGAHPESFEGGIYPNQAALKTYDVFFNQ
ncbi:MAG: DUF5060 domain-containing protein, partial [Verrucomicrobiota bacterium]